jgi:hypothetical protein
VQFFFFLTESDPPPPHRKKIPGSTPVTVCGFHLKIRRNTGLYISVEFAVWHLSNFPELAAEMSMKACVANNNKDKLRH